MKYDGRDERQRVTTPERDVTGSDSSEAVGFTYLEPAGPTLGRTGPGFAVIEPGVDPPEKPATARAAGAASAGSRSSPVCSWPS
jgi:hypothetical protein